MAVKFYGTNIGLFGVKDAGGLTIATASSVSERVDKKEIKGSEGDVVTVAYFNRRFECSLEGYGSVSGMTAGDAGSVAGRTVYIEEYTTSYSNEDFPKVSIKGTGYSF